MIKITIEKQVRREWQTTQNFLVKKTPTELYSETQKSPGYSGETTTTKDRKYIEEYEVREITTGEWKSTTLLQQEVEDESFDLHAVIAAFNGLQKGPKCRMIRR